ncbi:MAG: thioredoxin family protein [Alphaproteobacteria bacterium]|jgi:hypothetical protein|nr:thioredoxin family protein [Alphaproteobacteria bacterium]MDP6516474.1 thioredoxin family protein [Alphaproteobacteria bacterium]
MAEQLILVAKRDCPTCAMIGPVYARLAAGAMPVTVYSQDDPAFPDNIAGVVDDRELEVSYRYDIEIVPTLIRLIDGAEAGRAVGWRRDEWRALTGDDSLGADLPPAQPGCGARNVEPGMRERLMVRFGDVDLAARRIELGGYDDPEESCFERGWTDGLPVVPPTDERVVRMLAGTTRDADEIIGLMPPNRVPCSVEKVAINAVMAGCRPEYLPVVLAIAETALIPEFAMHGLLCTTYFSGPTVIVNGPVARAIGMNSGGNCLGQGNRANATIGRAFQLLISNVGGGVPGGIDRATFGNPGKYSFCFAEDESDPEWTPLSVARGFEPDQSTVTLFHGDGVQAFCDQKSRTPEALSRSLAMSLNAVGHWKLAECCNAILLLSPEHYAIYRERGWDRARIEAALHEATTRPGKDLVRDAHGVGEGMAPESADAMLPKFWRDHGLLVARAGGTAGLFSAIIGGWIGGRAHDVVQPVTGKIGT